MRTKRAQQRAQARHIRKVRRQHRWRFAQWLRTMQFVPFDGYRSLNGNILRGYQTTASRIGRNIGIALTPVEWDVPTHPTPLSEIRKAINEGRLP